MDRDSVVGTATRYGLDGQGIESRWGRGFPFLSRSVLEPTQPPVHWYRASFLGGKAAWAWRWPPTPSSAEVKERVALYLWDIVACYRVNFTLPFLYFLPKLDHSVHSVTVMCRAVWHTLINCHEHILQANTYYQASRYLLVSSSFIVFSSQSVPNTRDTTCQALLSSSSLPTRSYLSLRITTRNMSH